MSQNIAKDTIKYLLTELRDLELLMADKNALTTPEAPYGRPSTLGHSQRKITPIGLKSPCTPKRSPDFLSLRKENTKLREAVDKLKQEREYLIKHRKLSKLEQEEAFGKLQEFRQKYQDQVKSTDELTIAFHHCERKCKRLADRAGMQEGNLILLKKNLEEKTKQLQVLKTETESLREDNNMLTLYASQVPVFFRGINTALTVAKEKEQQVIEELGILRNDFEELEHQIILLSQILKVLNVDESETEHRLVAQENDKLVKQNVKLKAKIEAMSEGMKIGSKVIRITRKTLKEKCKQIDETSGQIDEVESLHKSRREDFQEVLSQENQLSSYVNSLVQQMEDQQRKIQEEVRVAAAQNEELTSLLEAKDAEIAELKADRERQNQ